MAFVTTRLAAGALLYSFFTSAIAASFSSRVGRKQQLSQATVHKRASLKAKLGLHTRAQEATGTASRRYATAFRASRAGASSHARLRGGLSTRQVPLYTPKIGLANVTEPTVVPPPPPPLNAWQDNQPLDTAVGHFLISGFIAQPTITPPPSQSSLDLVFSCPVLLTWSSELSVSVPDECSSLETGNWTGMDGGALLLNWEQSCFTESVPGIHAPQFSSVTTYRMENGDLFGSSQLEAKGPFRDAIVLRDCGGAAIYTIEEKLYKQVGKPIDEVCEKYRSCDGVVYLQYFIKDARGIAVAMTPYLTLFQNEITITDPSGILIATASRNGWDPPTKTDCTEGKRKTWDIKFADSPPGIWQSPQAQWPIAEMMTMLAQRDKLRQPTGRVIWSNCEVLKTTATLSSFALMFCALICCPFLCFVLCSGPCSKALRKIEGSMYPIRMGKPMMYGN